jgi:hypothetical protein
MPKANPYAHAQLVLRNGDPITEMRTPSGMQMMSTSTGEFNAYDKDEIRQSINQLFAAVNRQEAVHPGMVSTSAEMMQEREMRKQAFLEALSSDEKWASTGADLAVQIQEQRNREGFMRRVSVGQTLKTGDLPRVNVPMWDAMSVISTGPANVQFQLIRNKQFYPAEYEVTANLRADRVEMEQVGGDTLDNLYNMGLDSIMVKEDKLWKQAADLTVGSVNPMNYIVGQLTPQTLGNLRTTITDWNLPAVTAIIANDYWNDIIGNNDFSSFLDPVTKYDLVLNGELGTLVGLTLLTDGFRQPNQKVLERGEIYVLSTPEHHAMYSDRGGVRSEPTSGADQGSTSRGWLMSEIMSFTLANARSVAKGKRV